VAQDGLVVDPHKDAGLDVSLPSFYLMWLYCGNGLDSGLVMDWRVKRVCRRNTGTS